AVNEFPSRDPWFVARGSPIRDVGTTKSGPRITLLVRRDHDGHPIALHVGVWALGLAVRLDVDEQAVEDRPAQLHVRHLASAEADGGLDLVAVLEEADDVVLLELEIVLIDARPELHLLDHDDLLLLLGLALFL